MSGFKSILILLVFAIGIQASTYCQNEQYTYSRAANQFQIFNSSGVNISSEVTFISNFNTLFYYVYVPSTKDVLKLSYYSAAENKTNKAEVVLKGKEPNFILFDQQGNFSIYCEGRQMVVEDIHVSTPNTRIFVMSPKDSKYSYKFLYSEGYSGVAELERLPPNDHNTYWSRVLMKGDVTKSDFVIYANGRTPKLENVKILPNGHFLFSVDNQYFEIKNFKAAKLMAINALKPITKTQYDNSINATVNKVVAEIPAQLEDITKKQKLLKEIEDSKSVKPISRCNSDINCLLQLSETKYTEILNKGQSEEQAYDAMTKVFTEVYDSNPRATYEMTMKMKSEHVSEVIKRLPKEIRAALRSMAMQTVNEYEKKYGSPEIKTVPYKPKKN